MHHIISFLSLNASFTCGRKGIKNNNNKLTEAGKFFILIIYFFFLLQCNYSNWGTWKKINQSQCFLKTKES